MARAHSLPSRKAIRHGTVTALVANLAREAGIDDIGNGVGGTAQSAGLFNDDDTSDAADFDGSNDGDTGGDFGGGDGA